MKKNSIRKLTIAGVLVAVAVVGSLFSIPVLGAKCSPVQHMVNVLGAVLLGPWYALGMGFAAALIRNVLGLGSYPIAAFVMGNTKAALFTFVPSFLVSTAVGAAISVLVLSALKRTHVLSALEGAKR